MNGQFEQARSTLTPLLADAAHHPAVVTEQARLFLAREDFAAAERLGRTERAAQKDSLLVARELALALERLGRPRDAAEVALQSWLASPLEAGWAQETVLRLAPADARGVREVVRRAVAARPGRPDLIRARAVLDWRAGDLAVGDRGPRARRAARPGTGPAPLGLRPAAVLHRRLPRLGRRGRGADRARRRRPLRRELAPHRGPARLGPAVRARGRGRGRARAEPGAAGRAHGALAGRLPRGDRARPARGRPHRRGARAAALGRRAARGGAPARPRGGARRPARRPARARAAAARRARRGHARVRVALRRGALLRRAERLRADPLPAHRRGPAGARSAARPSSAPT